MSSLLYIYIYVYPHHEKLFWKKKYSFLPYHLCSSEREREREREREKVRERECMYVSAKEIVVVLRWQGMLLI